MKNSSTQRNKHFWHTTKRRQPVPNPQRGEVWMADLGMTAKVRPGLVLSVPVLAQDRALVTIVPHTTSVRGTRFEVAIQARFLKAGAFDVQGLRGLPHAKLERKLGTLTAAQLQSVEDAVRQWLSL